MNAQATPPAPPSDGRLAYKWKVLISVIFGVFMIILDTTVVNIAFQTLRREYGASLSASQWVISIYVLALGITTPIAGFLADRLGIKRVYVGGLTIFMLGSLLCGLAPTVSSSIWLLVAARALQGFGGGLAQPLGGALLFSTFPPEEQGKALGFFGIALVAAPAIGPILGGYLVDQNLWRWIFFINVPVGIVGVFLASRFLRDRRSDRPARLDPLGIVTSIIAFGSILFAASRAADDGWTSPVVLTGFIVGGIALVTFGIIELFFAREPMLNLRLFGNRNFLVANLVGYVSVLALFGAEFLMPVYLQALRGRSALETGIILLPLAVAAAVASPLAGRFYDKIGPRALVTVGFAILLINTWQLAQIQATTPIAWLAFLLGLRGLALGMTVQTTFATALASVPKPNLARGSSLINGSRFIVQSIAVALLSTVLTSALSPEIKAFGGAGEGAQAETTQRFGLCETPGVPVAQNVPPGTSSAAAPQARAGVERACNEYLSGFEQAYNLTFYAALAAVIIGAFLPGWPFHWAGRGALESPAPAH